MRFFQNLLLGYKAYMKAFRFIMVHGLYWYVAIPAVLMLGIYQLGAWIRTYHPESKAENMNDISWYMIRLLAELSIAILLMRFARYLVVIVLSPLLSHLSQKTEFLLTENRYPFELQQLIHDVKRGIRIALRNIMWEYFFFLVIFCVATIGWKDAKESPLFYLIFVIGFFYYGFSFLDYINERLRLDMDESIRFARNHRGLAIAIGSIYSVMIWIPIDLKSVFAWQSLADTESFGQFVYRFALNVLLWLCASFAPIWSIVAATIAMDDLVDLKNSYPGKENTTCP